MPPVARAALDYRRSAIRVLFDEAARTEGALRLEVGEPSFVTPRHIIEGAAEGSGLGHRFLRHIERNSVLLFVIPADMEDIAKDYAVLREELRRYNPELLY